MRHVLPRVDAIIGGSPCQDLSLAGKRAGFDGAKSSLWREYLRIVSQLRPRFMLLENVPGLHSSNGGWDFAEVLGGLAALGYDATWDVFRASDVGAPHRRERLFLLAYRVSGGCDGVENGASRDILDGSTPRREEGADRVANGGQIGGLADSASLGGGARADEGVAIAARGEARLEPGRGGESLADAEQREGRQRHDPDVLWRRAGDAEQTRMGGSGRTGDVVDPRGVDVQRLGRSSVVPSSAGDSQSEAHERQRCRDSACGASEGVGMVDPDRLAHSECIGRQGPWESRQSSGDSTGCHREASRIGGDRTGSAQSGMGGDAYGLPLGLVRPSSDAVPSQGIAAHRWPVGRGQPQAPHEPPRTAHGVVNRSHALRAYGNAVVPQVASLAWQTLFARIVESERRR
jgi:site-specific DNA-cytosine methylase